VSEIDRGTQGADMPAPVRRERYAHRARWRPVPKAMGIPTGGRTAPVPSQRLPGRCVSPPTSMPDLHASVTGLDLPQLFAPAEAAAILRHLGLTEMTECALRTRAYRRQVPFHLNGRRIRFTADDLREIVEGQSRRPESKGAAPQSARGQAHRRSQARAADHPPQTWRARQPRAASAVEGPQPR
jgi:hypothetical protein